MRLVDLHCDWLRQYATETTLYEGGLYPEIPGRVGRLDGYLLGSSLAVLACARKPDAAIAIVFKNSMPNLLDAQRQDLPIAVLSSARLRE